MSGRSDILDGLIEVLLHIKQSDGYNTTPNKVVRGFIPYEKLHKFPNFMVFGGNETFEHLMDGVSTRSAFTIKIRGIILDKGDPEGALCDAISDIIKVLESTDNPYREEMIVHSVDTDEGWYQLEREGSGYFEVSLDIFYTFNRSTP